MTLLPSLERDPGRGPGGGSRAGPITASGIGPRNLRDAHGVRCRARQGNRTGVGEIRGVRRGRGNCYRRRRCVIIDGQGSASGVAGAIGGCDRNDIVTEMERDPGRGPGGGSRAGPITASVVGPCNLSNAHGVRCGARQSNRTGVGEIRGVRRGRCNCYRRRRHVIIDSQGRGSGIAGGIGGCDRNDIVTGLERDPGRGPGGRSRAGPITASGIGPRNLRDARVARCRARQSDLYRSS